MEPCIFCKIAQHQLATDVLYEDQNILAFKDIAPKAPVHLLIIPKKHIATLNEVQDFHIMAQMMATAVQLAKQQQIAASGYRLLMNCNQQAGQEVFHIHLHLLGGKKLGSIG